MLGQCQSVSGWSATTVTVRPWRGRDCRGVSDRVRVNWFGVSVSYSETDSKRQIASTRGGGVGGGGGVS